MFGLSPAYSDLKPVSTRGTRTGMSIRGEGLLRKSAGQSKTGGKREWNDDESMYICQASSSGQQPSLASQFNIICSRQGQYPTTGTVALDLWCREVHRQRIREIRSILDAEIDEDDERVSFALTFEPSEVHESKSASMLSVSSSHSIHEIGTRNLV